MRLVGTAENVADPLCEFLSTKQPLGLYDLSLTVGIHLGSIGLSQGLFLGSKQATMRTPQPLFLTPLLCSAIQLLISLEVCQLALSQIRSRAFLPIARSFCQLH